MTGETIHILRATLAKQRRNLRLLTLQSADYPPNQAPLHLLNQLHGLERAIDALERDLRALGDDPATVSADDLPLPEPAAAIASPATRPAPQMAPRLDAHVGRPAELAAIKDALLEAAAGAVVAIRGAAGFGKTTLAAMVCHDPAIRAAFPGGVLWATLGEQPDALAAIAVLARSLGSAEPRFINLEDAAGHLAQALADRRCLVVLDDVWQAASLAPFLRIATPAAWLITTRMLDLAPDARTIAVAGMAEAEAAALLALRLPDRPDAPAALVGLARRLGAWPLLLNLAGAYLAEQVGVFGRPQAQALAALEARYDRAGIAAFNQRDAHARNAAADRSLAVSLELLDEAARRRFAELAVFAEDAAIPLALAARLWGLDPLAAEDQAQHYARLSLAQLDLAGETLLLHDVVRGYLARQLGDEWPAVHRRLLAAHRAGGELLLADDDSYLWERVFWHLREAGLADELLARAADLPLLARRIARDGAGAALGDLRLVRQAAPADPISAILARELALLPQLFAPLADWRDCGHALLTRLGHEPALAESLRALLSALPPPWILPVHPLPDRPDPALRAVLSGHAAPVRACALSADGSVAVSGGDDGTLRIWDVSSGLVRHAIAAQTDQITSCALSADGRVVASGGADGMLRLWEAETGAARHALPGHAGAVLGCALSADGATVASAGSDGTVRVWDATAGTVRHLLRGHTGAAYCCALSADGRTVISGGSDGIVRLWDAGDGRFRMELGPDGPAICGCALSADGRTVVATAENGTVRFWDAASGTKSHMIRGLKAKNRHSVSSGLNPMAPGHIGAAFGCAVSADGSLALTVGKDQLVRIWETATGRLRAAFAGHSDWVRSCALSADGATVLSASDDGTARIWAAAAAAELSHSLETGRIRACGLSADGAVAMSAGQNGIVRIWDWAGWLHYVLASHRGPVQCCALSADGAVLISAGADRKVVVSHMHNSREFAVLTGHSDWVRGCALNADGTIIVSASDDGTVRLWDGRDGSALHVLSGHKRDVHACAVSADGGLVVSAGSDGTVRLWDGRIGGALHVLAGHRGDARCCAASADGGLIVSGGDDATVRVWDGRDGRALRALAGHRGRVYGCAASADGSIIASAGGDGMVWRWDLAGGADRVWLADDRLAACAMSADGSSILAGGTKGLYWLAVWRTAEAALAALERYRAACAE